MNYPSSEKGSARSGPLPAIAMSRHIATLTHFCGMSLRIEIGEENLGENGYTYG